jgi:hypothetical protein
MVRRSELILTDRTAFNKIGFKKGAFLEADLIGISEPFRNSAAIEFPFNERGKK